MKSEYAVFGEIANQKYGRLDVRVKAESGRIFDVEVQIDKDYMNERGFFYGIRIGEEEFKSGSSYIHMPEVRVINLVDFYVRDDNLDFPGRFVATSSIRPFTITFFKWLGQNPVHLYFFKDSRLNY